MEDIKQMIENAKQKLADEKEKARKLVEENERLNAELEAALMPAQAPSPSATELDRIVAVVDKINEKADITDKLRVQSVAGLRKGIEMIGGDDDLTMTSKAWNDGHFTTKANVALDNVNVGNSNAGKIIQVKADGKLEYITMSSLKTALGIPTRKDITATYATRKWNVNDAGKKVYITVEGNGIKVGFISEGKDTLLIAGGAIVDLGVAITAPDWHTKFYWSTKHVSNVGYIEIKKNNYNIIHETFYNIIKFEIEE